MSEKKLFVIEVDHTNSISYFNDQNLSVIEILGALETVSFMVKYQVSKTLHSDKEKNEQETEATNT